MGGGTSLPSGTVTFLFTDIERSTETVEAMGNEAYADVLETHKELLRDAVKSHGGYEIGTEGDAFFVVFERAGDAVRAAVDGQRALDDHPLRVRMGVHTGEALVRDRDYVGHDVHKAKRITDAGHGGQIVLSQTTADLVRATTDVRDLGPHRLKDLGEPQHLFQVRAEGLRDEFPALRTLDAAPHNLPVQLTSFVGRERELGEIAEMLAKHRLVTLTGVGGCGKTRLAIHAAAAEVESSPDGVFFCDLSRLSDEAALAPAVAQALDLELSTGQQVGSLAAIDAIRSFLQRRNALLVLDNCEHLVGAVADLVEDLLTSCPHLRVLATSREALEVSGEQTWSIPSLTATDEAVQLFAERAASVRGDFALTDMNRVDIDAICQRLDGIPLAIELAAAQIGHLGPRQIAERLDQRFMILTGGRRRVQRQQTLQAAMDWSWELLDERDRTLLRRLSVFQGGCALEAAEAVCGEGIDVVGGLRSLVGKSLVLAEQRDGAARYRLLETVRLYAEDKQAESEESEDLRTRHRDYYLEWAEAIPIERVLWGPIFAGSELLPEEDNIRAALRWSQARGEFELMARILSVTRRLWAYHHGEAPRWYEPALAADLPDQLRGRLLLAWTMTRATPMSPAVGTGMEDATRLLRGRPSAWLTNVLGINAQRTLLMAIATRDEELAKRAYELVDEAGRVARELGPFWESIALFNRGALLLMQLRHDEAADAFLEGARKFPMGAPVGVPYMAIDSFEALRHVMSDGWTDELESAYRTIARGREDDIGPMNLGVILGMAAKGDHARAEEQFRDVVSTRRDAPNAWYTIAFAYAGALAGVGGDFERAARLLAFAMKLGFIMSSSAYAVYRHWIPLVREALGPERARQLREEGRAMSRDEAIEYALGERDA